MRSRVQVAKKRLASMGSVCASVDVTTDGGPVVVPIPACSGMGRMSIRVNPERGQTVTIHDSLSPDAAVLDGSAVWEALHTTAVLNGRFSRLTTLTIDHAISGLRISGDGTVEVLGC